MKKEKNKRLGENWKDKTVDLFEKFINTIEFIGESINNY